MQLCTVSAYPGRPEKWIRTRDPPEHSSSMAILSPFAPPSSKLNLSAISSSLFKSLARFYRHGETEMDPATPSGLSSEGRATELLITKDVWM